MFGQNGTGLNFKAGSASLANPSTVAQADTTFGQSQDALKQQADFVAALQGQNGIQNQSNVFNQEQGVVNGTGPNPAAAMLAQSTGNNVASTTAAMAGQRGSAQNVGMIARQAGQTGSNLQQQAAGQAATLQANQSLNAMNASAGIAGQQVGQQQAATATQLQGAQQANQTVLGGIAGQNQAAVSNMAQQNDANAGIARIAAKGQQDMLGGLMNGAGVAAGMAKGGKVQKMAEGGAPLAPTVPAAVAAPAPVMPQAPKQGPLSAVGKHLAGTTGAAPQTSGSYQTGNTVGGAIGAGVKALFGGQAPSVTADQPMPSASDWASWAKTPEGAIPSSQENYNMMKNLSDEPAPSAAAKFNAAQNAKGPDMGMPDASLYSSESAQPRTAKPNYDFAKGGKVPAMVSPGEVYLPPSKVKEVKSKGNKPGDAIKTGEKIPGKAKVKGNSYANDTVHKNLEEGGLVIPKSVMESKDPAKESAKFVAAYMARGGIVPRRAK
jgi:hypothetical protein